jgi:hypothetical protein
MEAENTVRCNTCDWEGQECDLVRFHDGDDVGDGCPICVTDDCLMDISIAARERKEG